MVIDFIMCLITAGVSIGFALGSYEVPEENATMAVCALLTGLTEIPVMVELATASGTAIQGTYTRSYLVSKLSQLVNVTHRKACNTENLGGSGDETIYRGLNIIIIDFMTCIALQ